MKLIKDYDCVIDYHPGKANVVADALSRKSVQTLQTLNAHLSLSDDGAIGAELMARSNLLNQVQEAQKSDEKISAIVSVRYCTVFSFIVLLYCESYIYKSNM